MTTTQMELALVNFFDARRNLIVPNVHWAMFRHELDLMILTKAGYCYEVEIKISKADLIKDKKKRHGHHDYRNRIKYLYFALPEKLEKEVEHIPERAGIIIVREIVGWGNRHYTRCDVIRSPQTLGKYKFSDSERYEVARLGALRIWSLKQRVQKLRAKRKREGVL